MLKSSVNPCMTSKIGSLVAIPSLSTKLLVAKRLRGYCALATPSQSSRMRVASPRILPRTARRSWSAAAQATTATQPSESSSFHRNDEENGPSGILFSTNKPPIGADLVGATGTILRTFGPRSNAEGLLATGGAALAAHASFDPDYKRAQDWIRHHAVGPAVLSPILIAGLTGALTEAAFPHGVNTAQTTRQYRPLIVGVPVAAMIQVMSVQLARRMGSGDAALHNDELANNTKTNSNVDHDSASERDGDVQKRNHGYNVVLRTTVTRVRDDCVIAEGSHELWVPDYGRM